MPLKLAVANPPVREPVSVPRRGGLPVLAVDESEAWRHHEGPLVRRPFDWTTRRAHIKTEARVRGLRDAHGRPLTNLRISIHHACNLACAYCHAEGQQKEEKRMTPGEIARLARLAASFGARKVKLTGGEPLLRDDIDDIVRLLRPHVDEVSMTTNGVRLAEWAHDLKDAGLDRVNVSIDTLDPHAFARIRGADVLPVVLEGVEAARRVGLPVRVNMVVQAETADEDIARMRRYVADRGLRGLQLIELHGPQGIERNAYFRAHHRSLRPIEAALRKEAIIVTRRQMHARPTYVVPEGGRQVPIEIVEPYRNARFCAHCTRLRVTSDGELKPCLMRADNHVNVLDAMRRGATDEELEDMLLEANYRREPYWLPGDDHGQA